ncbi:unnamed protein product [Lupinus luteus]|uniref:RRM domain-containing protein n=1 Tax=Lupinus luteus TaxID=3873 RepID=A0AAV1XZG7_LUPLU
MAASIASSFLSSSITTLKSLRSKNFSIDPPVLTTSSNHTMLPSFSLSYSYIVEPLSITTMSQNLCLPRISAAVTEQELVVDAEEKKVDENEMEEEAEEDTENSISTKLYFGNLPYSVDSAQLAGLIQDYGSAELIEVLYDRGSGKSRGFAFVTMTCIEDCNTVIENLDGREFMGRTLRVNFSDKPKPKLPLYPETDHKLFVGNLSWSATSEGLIQAFQEYGKVVGARVLYDGETGRS